MAGKVAVMTCKACEAGLRHPRSDLFEAACDGCSARAVAALGLHLESESIDPPQMTIDYRRVLKQMFGERAKAGHALTMEWASRIKAADARSTAVNQPMK